MPKSEAMWMSSLLFGAAVLSFVQAACPRYETSYYEGVGCTPEAAGPDGCPTSYDCSSLRQRDQTKCYYQGQAYERDDTLDSPRDSPCLVNCNCNHDSDVTNKTAFECVNVECPADLNGPPDPGCYHVYQHGHCCETDTICPDSDAAEQKSQKAVCEFDGKTLYEGQEFYPEDEPCLKCICQQGYTGSYVEPFCHKITCDYELLHGQQVGDCAPIHFGETGCCPIDWRCPKPTDKVITSESASPSDRGVDKKCQWGGLELSVGDRLSASSEWPDTECTCRLPPLPVCIQRNKRAT